MIRSISKEKTEIIEAIRTLLDPYRKDSPFQCNIILDEPLDIEEEFAHAITAMWLNDKDEIEYSMDEESEIYNLDEENLYLDTLFSIYETLKTDIPHPDRCPYCGSTEIKYLGDQEYGIRQWACKECQHQFYPDDERRCHLHGFYDDVDREE